jgi:divalent metal cation (Fe/Co/Zn/Cd) transporter
LSAVFGAAEATSFWKRGSPQLSVEEGHALAKEVRHEAMHHFGYLSNVVIHIDPMQEAGEEFHRIHAHTHDGLPVHSH